MSDDIAALRLRLAVCRSVIHSRFIALDVELTAIDDTWSRLVVSHTTQPEWVGENVVVWCRNSDDAMWAVQDACPHAAISLAESDIEDFGDAFSITDGPCIACPAHMYVFDVGSGACLTDPVTSAARTYSVFRYDGRLWLSREPRPAQTSPWMKPGGCDVQAMGNELQLRLVQKGLRRRFGYEDEDDEDAPVPD